VRDATSRRAAAQATVAFAVVAAAAAAAAVASEVDIIGRMRSLGQRKVTKSLFVLFVTSLLLFSASSDADADVIRQSVSENFVKLHVHNTNTSPTLGTGCQTLCFCGTVDSNKKCTYFAFPTLI